LDRFSIVMKSKMFVFVSIDLVRRKISVTFYDLSVGKNKDILSYSTYSAFSYNLHIFHVRHTRYSVYSMYLILDMIPIIILISWTAFITSLSIIMVYNVF
jgi:hypothetical protein